MATHYINESTTGVGVMTIIRVKPILRSAIITAVGTISLVRRRLYTILKTMTSLIVVSRPLKTVSTCKIITGLNTINILRRRTLCIIRVITSTVVVNISRLILKGDKILVSIVANSKLVFRKTIFNNVNIILTNIIGVRKRYFISRLIVISNTIQNYKRVIIRKTILTSMGVNISKYIYKTTNIIVGVILKVLIKADNILYDIYRVKLYSGNYRIKKMYENYVVKLYKRIFNIRKDL